MTESFFDAPADLQRFYQHALMAVGGVAEQDMAQVPIRLLSRMYAPRMNLRLHECVVWWYLLLGAQGLKEIELRDGVLRDFSDELINWFKTRQALKRQAGEREAFTLYHVLIPQLTEPGVRAGFHEILDGIHINLTDESLDGMETTWRSDIGHVLIWALHVLVVLDLFQQLDGATEGWPEMLEFLQQQILPEELALMYELLALMQSWLPRLEMVPAYQEGSATGRTLYIILDYLSDHAYTSSLVPYQPRAISARAARGNLHISDERVWIA